MLKNILEASYQKPEVAQKTLESSGFKYDPELSSMKAKVFTDKEGKPQISLDVTVINIQFSPFGKPEKSSDNQNQETRQEYQAQENVGIAQGSNQNPEISLDDEIPF